MSLTLSDVRFTHAGSASPALRGVNFSVHRGETVAVIGPNGSGKTTLGYVLCGIIPHLLRGAFEGRVQVGERDLLTLAPGEINRLVGYTFQDPESQFVSLRVRDELLFGPEQARKEVELLESFDLMSLLDRDPAALSMGQKQRVALASVLVGNPEVLVLDEPSAMLDSGAKRNLVSLLKARKAEHAVVLLAHDLDLVEQLADRVVGIKEGAVRFDKPYAQVNAGDLEALFGIQGQLRPFDVADKNFDLDARVQDVFYRFPKGTAYAISDVTLNLSDSWGLVGDNGSGKSTLLLLLAGLLSPSRGTIERNFALPQAAHKANEASMVFQNPNHQIFAPTIYDELAFTLRNQGHPEGDIQKRISSVAPSFGLRELERDPHTLSFGWRKIVSLAEALVTRPSVLLVDEPEAGLDPSSAALVRNTLKAFTRQGGKPIVASHDPSFLKGLVGGVSLLEHGQLVWNHKPEEALVLLEERYAGIH